ncbi:MAG TPA: hypothetical protein VMA34_02375 [Terracidiphilus sp.]|nr:hypothetical protein [Terracidiphilus sp.]
MNLNRPEQKRMIEEGPGASSDLDRKFWAALVMYAVLAVLVWFTMSADKVPVLGHPVEFRWIPMFVIGVLALRTLLARHAEKIRRGS